MKSKYKTIGIIGGVGSLATLDLFGKILTASGANNDQEYPRILIDNNSSIPDRSTALLHRGISPVPDIVETAQRLILMGAEVLAIPCNTAHAYFTEIQKEFAVPLVHVVDEVAYHLRVLYPNAKRVAIMATTGTVFSRIYEQSLEKYNLQVITLGDLVQEKIMESIYGDGGLKSGGIENPRKILLEVMRYIEARRADVTVLACTELPLVLRQEDTTVPLVDSTMILAEAIIRKAKLE